MGWVVDAMLSEPRTVRELAMTASEIEIRSMLARANQDFILRPFYRAVATAFDAR